MSYTKQMAIVDTAIEELEKECRGVLFGFYDFVGKTAEVCVNINFDSFAIIVRISICEEALKDNKMVKSLIKKAIEKEVITQLLWN